MLAGGVRRRNGGLPQLSQGGRRTTEARRSASPQDMTDNTGSPLTYPRRLVIPTSYRLPPANEGSLEPVATSHSQCEQIITTLVRDDSSGKHRIYGCGLSRLLRCGPRRLST